MEARDMSDFRELAAVAVALDTKNAATAPRRFASVRSFRYRL